MPYSATLWPEATVRYKYNVSDPTSAAAVSLGVGALGGDIFYGCWLGDNGGDPGDTRHLLTSGDAPWAIAAGQNRGTGWSQYVNNALWLQTGLDPSTATMASYKGGSQTTADALAYFPRSPETPGWRKYPLSAVRIEDMVLVLGMHHRDAPGEGQFNTAPMGPWAIILTGIDDGAPDTWGVNEVPVGMPNDDGLYERSSFLAGNGIVVRDGYVHTWCQGPYMLSGYGGRVAVCRWPVEDVLRGNLMRPEWADLLGGWLSDDRREGLLLRENVIDFPNVADQTGGVCEGPDGVLRYFIIPQTFVSQDPRVTLSATADPDETFEVPFEVYDIPMAGDGYDFCYGPFGFEHMTWSGKTASQMVALLSRNRHTTTDVFSDMRKYWPEALKVTYERFDAAYARWIDRVAFGEPIDVPRRVYGPLAPAGTSVDGNAHLISGSMNIATELFAGSGYIMSAQRGVQSWLEDSEAFARVA